MPPIEIGQDIELHDKDGRDLGRFTVRQFQDVVVIGAFTPTPAFEQIRQVFADFERCVNNQEFSFLDEMCDRIAALGIYGRSGRDTILMDDLQICFECQTNENASFRPVS